MSVYKKALDKEFYRLHPMLQKRYSFSNHAPFQAQGVMKSIKVGPKFLYPLFWLGTKRKLLFPEYGTNIPFKILNTPFVGADGEEQIHWERVFYFGEKKRYFNALMSYDPERNLIKDYLGEPSILYSDLVFIVSSDGSLRIESSKQRLVLWKIEIPIPKILQGLATVTEKYSEEKRVFQISVDVRNPLIGHIFSYEGEFKPNEK
ncbi:DUF4166 domain-containing protein [Ureibacillus aquaedulcis]|uniref:DUF4166 domain-containing protein n=1 Tax=Ureibacillus aquaedulcis TaxID=3058421 RepID=A0ABT8GNN8_9BACL|nr:DUF4166 domain-containing protein [Ureibacillus sp. BA0131]MDN4492551.1 DUF4166 domain-containing protein [Ureibacillus sp. BA0131]